jgi:hypothetical protein
MSVSMLGMSKQPLATQFELPVDVASTLAMAPVVSTPHGPSGCPRWQHVEAFVVGVAVSRQVAFVHPGSSGIERLKR